MTKENVGWRVEAATKAYVRFAAAMLDKTQEQIVEDAIQLHREYFTRTGIVFEEKSGT